MEKPETEIYNLCEQSRIKRYIYPSCDINIEPKTLMVAFPYPLFSTQYFGKLRMICKKDVRSIHT
jgi:hypothetical protein